MKKIVIMMSLLLGLGIVQGVSAGSFTMSGQTSSVQGLTGDAWKVSDYQWNSYHPWHLDGTSADWLRIMGIKSGYGPLHPDALVYEGNSATYRYTNYSAYKGDKLGFQINPRYLNFSFPIDVYIIYN